MEYKELKLITTGHNTEETLWNYINSECIATPGFKLDLNSEEFYIYQTIEEFICIHLDIGNSNNEELADEEPFDGNEAPLYFTSCNHRVSPVYRLWQIMSQFKKKFKTSKVFGILLSDSTFINENEICKIWNRLGISVRSKLINIPDSLPYKKLNIKNEHYADIYIDNMPTPNEYSLEIQDILTEKNIEDQLTETPNPEIKANDIIDNDTKCEINWKDLVEDNDPDFFEIILEKKIPKPLPAIKILQPLHHPEEELSKIVGMDEIKSRLTNLSYLAVYNKHAQEFGLKINKLNYHSIFLGDPGTGKTTIALIMGSLFKKNGLLSRGHTIVANRGSFVGKVWGSEEENVRRILKLSQGGVLVIDEAYLMYNVDEPRDPCNKIIPLMLNLLSDETNRDIVVILCGYKKEMEALLNSNPGIRSRFRNYFYFKNYELDELSEILHRKATESGYKFSNRAWMKILKIINNHLKNRHKESYANARDIMNLWEEVLENHAYRCISNNFIDFEHIREINDEDIP